MDLSDKDIDRIANRVADQIIERLEKQGLVITHKQEAEREQLKRRFLKKRWLTIKEIADANLWGISSKAGVRRIIETEAEEHNIYMQGKKLTINKREVIRIGARRGTLDPEE